MKNKINLAYFITSHGFGHASRAAAVMSAMLEIEPSTHFDIYTQTPAWFFEDGLTGKFTHHPVQSDIGIVQSSPLIENIQETLDRLDQFIPFHAKMVDPLVSSVKSNRSKLIICDISPLGIAVAKNADIPSLLIENFTWDWIYQNHLTEQPGFEKHIQYLKEINNNVTYHIQTDPVCNRNEKSDYFIPPISRPYHQSAQEIRKELDIPSNASMVLITMGGIPEKFQFLSNLHQYRDIHFVIPGASDAITFEENCVLLPHHSTYHHPDLIRASNAIIGKAGYSTIAETYHAGIPFGYVTRSNFRESACLASFIENKMNGIEISDTDFSQGQWMENIPELLTRPVIQRHEENGAAIIARVISNSLLW